MSEQHIDSIMHGATMKVINSLFCNVRPNCCVRINKGTVKIVKSNEEIVYILTYRFESLVCLFPNVNITRK